MAKIAAKFVLEIAGLVKDLEEKWGIRASAPMAAIEIPVAGAAAEVKEEKTEFDII
jgi:large subunit ribosomal protein L7/L12